jgi:divalent metal cation (Fe/Co/Zn/Cd) transporter
MFFKLAIAYLLASSAVVIAAPELQQRQGTQRNSSVPCSNSDPHQVVNSVLSSLSVAAASAVSSVGS